MSSVIARDFEAFRSAHWPHAKRGDVLRAFGAYCAKIEHHLEGCGARLEEVELERVALDKVRARLARELAPFGPPTLAQLQALLPKPRAFFAGPEKLLAGARVSETLDERTSEDVRSKVQAASQLLSTEWLPCEATDKQAILAVHADKANGRTIVHVGCGRLGSFLIEIDRLLAPPEEAAKEAIGALRKLLDECYGDSEPVVVVDGDHQTVNFKDILPDRVVLRSRSDRAMELVANLASVQSSVPLRPENTRIVSGLPENEQDLRAVVRNAPASWGLWKTAARDWTRHARQEGYDASLVTATSSLSGREQLLSALREKPHVIVLIAHAEDGRIYFPQPRPDGSVLSKQDLDDCREEISRNRPMVYLFCCATAQIDEREVESFSQALLRSGAAAVVAPQGSIPTGPESIALFSGLLGAPANLSPLQALRQAERRTNFRRMETWIA